MRCNTASFAFLEVNASIIVSTRWRDLADNLLTAESRLASHGDEPEICRICSPEQERSRNICSPTSLLRGVFPSERENKNELSNREVFPGKKFYPKVFFRNGKTENKLSTENKFIRKRFLRRGFLQKGFLWFQKQHTRTFHNFPLEMMTNVLQMPIFTSQRNIKTKTLFPNALYWSYILHLLNLRIKRWSHWSYLLD